MLVRWTERPAQPRQAWREVNRLFDETFGLINQNGNGWQHGSWLPAVDVNEDSKAYRIALELPGVKMADVKVQVDGNRLTVSGEKKQEIETPGRSERRYGSFTRAFTLPDTVDTDRIDAQAQDGVLTIMLPKTEKAQPREIPITTSA